MRANVYTVSQVNRYIRGMFSQDILLSSVTVKGEVSNCKYHGSGHVFFSLKDGGGVLGCVLFSGNRKGLPFRLKDGDEVACSGSIEVYERDGSYRLYVKSVKRTGEGELFERIALLKAELAEMGLFDASYKQEVPKYAMRVGVVTASTGAAIRDIENVSRRRNPYVELVLYPARVQGEGAPESIVRGIRRLDAMGLDVLIVGRGGGAIEDLMAFNTEEVARAIFEAETPIISAVGHETDTTIADFVADLRAPTPSAAAELAVFDYSAFLARCRTARERLFREESRRIGMERGKARYAKARIGARDPRERLRAERRRLSEMEDAMREAIKARLAGKRRAALTCRRRMTELMRATFISRRMRLYGIAGKFSGLNPVKRLSSGFAFVADGDGRAVRSIEQVKPGDFVSICVMDGKIRAEVCEVSDNG